VAVAIQAREALSHSFGQLAESGHETKVARLVGQRAYEHALQLAVLWQCRVHDDAASVRQVHDVNQVRGVVRRGHPQA
jgi:hypothetical protein